ncbi:MAG TPA: hypothetical protein PLO67_01350 [Saprospiraceae bacterium]|nr:hypothetical protein [Saprospiraceae bacterium]HPI05583.1 hypothetical protein [Saprospiraceae bacterium]
MNKLLLSFLFSLSGFFACRAQSGYSYYEYLQCKNKLNDAFFKSDSVDYVSNIALMRRLEVYDKNLNCTIGIALHQDGRDEAALESLKACMKYGRTDTLLSFSFFADSVRGRFQDVCCTENRKWKAYYKTHYGRLDSILQLINVSDQTFRRKVVGIQGASRDSLMHLQGKIDSINWIRLSGILDTLLENFYFIDAHKSTSDFLYLGVWGGHFPEAACRTLYKKTHAASIAGKVNWEQLVGLEWQLMFKYPFREDSTGRYYYLEHLVTSKKGDIDLEASYIQLEAMYSMLHDNSHAQVEISYAARKSNPHLQESLKAIQQFLLDKGISQKQFSIRPDTMPAGYLAPDARFTFIWKQKG